MLCLQWVSAVAQQKQRQLLVSPGDWSYGRGLAGVNNSCWALGSLQPLTAQLLGDTNWRHNPSFGELDFGPCAATSEVTKNAGKSPHIPESSKYSHSAGMGACCALSPRASSACPAPPTPHPRVTRLTSTKTTQASPRQSGWGFLGCEMVCARSIFSDYLSQQGLDPFSCSWLKGPKAPKGLWCLSQPVKALPFPEKTEGRFL